jgi:hypothetical protein
MAKYLIDILGDQLLREPLPDYPVDLTKFVFQSFGSILLKNKLS